MLQPCTEVTERIIEKSGKCHCILEDSEVFLEPGQAFLSVWPRHWTVSQGEICDSREGRTSMSNQQLLMRLSRPP